MALGLAQWPVLTEYRVCLWTSYRGKHGSTKPSNFGGHPNVSQKIGSVPGIMRFQSIGVWGTQVQANGSIPRLKRCNTTRSKQYVHVGFPQTLLWMLDYQNQWKLGTRPASWAWGYCHAIRPGIPLQPWGGWRMLCQCTSWAWTTRTTRAPTQWLDPQKATDVNPLTAKERGNFGMVYGGPCGRKLADNRHAIQVMLHQCKTSEEASGW